MTNKATKIILAIIASLIIFVALLSAMFLINQLVTKQQPTVDYWIINISPTWAGGYVIPNGTIYVPMNQTGIAVTAHPTGWNGFYHWILDGEQIENQSSTIFVPRQQANSTHTLGAQFIQGTPPVRQIVHGLITVNASSYRAYNFTIPSEPSQAEVSGHFTASGGNGIGINVYIMDSDNFTSCQNCQNASQYYDSGESTNSSIRVNLPSRGTYYIVYDNTFDNSSQKNVDTDMYSAYIPKDTGDPSDVSIVKDSLNLTMSLEKVQYELEEQVPITFTIINVSNQTINFINQGPVFSFQVHNSTNNFVYSWIFGAHPIDITTRVLAPNENFTMTLAWAQNYNSTPSPIPVGTYYIIGENPSNQIQTPPLYITIYNP